LVRTGISGRVGRKYNRTPNDKENQPLYQIETTPSHNLLPKAAETPNGGNCQKQEDGLRGDEKEADVVGEQECHIDEKEPGGALPCFWRPGIVGSRAPKKGPEHHRTRRGQKKLHGVTTGLERIGQPDERNRNRKRGQK